MSHPHQLPVAAEPCRPWALVALLGLVLAACAQIPDPAPREDVTRLVIRFQDGLPADHPDRLRLLSERTGCTVTPAAPVAVDTHAYRFACHPADAGAERLLGLIRGLPGVADGMVDGVKTSPLPEPKP